VLEIGFDDSDGVGLLRRVKAEHPEQNVLMVSNFDETQREAQAAGALPGFGKREIGSDKVRQRIADAVS
jgi:DNA-binding NarL/FixJ family response regulator